MEKNNSEAKRTPNFYLHIPPTSGPQKPVLHPKFLLSCTPPTI